MNIGMPLPQQQHSPHFMSSLTAMLGHSHGHGSKPNSLLPSATGKETLAAATSSVSGHGFEASLSERLSSLIPMEDVPFLTLQSLSLSLSVLLHTQEDLTSLTSSSPPQYHTCFIRSFLDRSIHLMDICKAISVQISILRQCIAPLELVIQSLLCTDMASGLNKPMISSFSKDMASMSSSFTKGKLSFRLTPGHVRRARKAITELYILVGDESDVAATSAMTMAPRQQHTIHGSSLHASNRVHAHENLAVEASQPKRWLSWHGTCSNNLSQPARQLQSIASGLAAPRWSDGVDMDQKLGGRIYALNTITVFFLSTIMTALPDSGKNSIITLNHPGSFPWSSAFVSLQEKVQDEIKRKGKRSRTGNLFELGQIFSIVKKLLEVTEPTAEKIILNNEKREEIRVLVKQLRQYVDEVKKDLESLDGQIRDLHGRLLSERVGLLNLFSYGIVS